MNKVRTKSTKIGQRLPLHRRNRVRSPREQGRDVKNELQTKSGADLICTFNHAMVEMGFNKSFLFRSLHVEAQTHCTVSMC